MKMDVDIAILGAGIAAGAALAPIREAGLSFVVLDKSRGVGGRAATRRIDGIPVDHGAQFFTVRTDAFEDTVRRWLSAGICMEWSDGFHQYREEKLHPPPAHAIHARYACANGMTAIAKSCFHAEDVLREHLAISVHRDDHHFLTSCENGQVIRSKALLSTLPFPQAQKLLAAFFDEPNRFALDLIRMEPCLAAIIELHGFTPEWKGVQVQDDDTLSWIGADFSKRTPTPERRFAVLHATADFSNRHLEGDLPAAGRLMLERSRQICPALGDAELVQTHRWRYAKSVLPLEEIAFWKLPDVPLALAGDSFGRGNIESAWLSGLAAGEQLAAELS